MNARLKSLLKQYGGPKDLILNTIQNENPIINNLIKMMNEGNYKGVEKFAENLYNERGGDFRKDFSQFMRSIKG